jgi:hypothetical protein
MKLGLREIAITSLATVLLVGCPPKNGTVQIQATDAPFAGNIVSGATIQVSQIQMHTDATATSGFVTVFDASTAGGPVTMDLLHLRNGVTQSLSSAQIPPGDYRQVRLVVSGASLNLTNSNSYAYPHAAGTTGDIQPTSTSQSGLKVMIDPPLTVVSNVTSTLLLDVDLSHTFLPTPANDALNANGYHLQPVIRAANTSTVGTITGKVTDASNAAVANATVDILDASNTAVTTTITDANGSYAAMAIAPATSYTVRATLGNATGQNVSQPVAAGSNTVVNVQIH